MKNRCKNQLRLELGQYLVISFKLILPVLWVVVSVGAGQALAQPTTSPDITPGAVRPQQQPDVLPDRSEPEISIPAVDQRPMNLDEGPAIPLQEIVVTYDESTKVSEGDKQDVIELAQNYLQENQNVLTFGRLEEVAQRITEQLRDNGYILARAVLPPQQIENEVVRISVYIGMLGAVSASNNQLYTDRILERPFRDSIGEAVKQENVESNLLRINDLPGIDAVAVFGPGQNVGETRLDIKTVNESSIDYSARVDNHAVQASGDIRLSLGAAVNNLTGHRDRLRVDAVKTFNSGDLRNARVNYEVTLPELVHTLGIGYSETRYDVERGPARNIGLDGDIEIGDLYLRSSWVRSRSWNFSSELSLSTKRAEVDVRQFPDFFAGIDRLTVASLFLVADGVDTRLRGIHRATLGFHRGIDDFIGSMDENGNRNSLTRINGTQELSGRFEKVTASYNRLQALTANHSLLLRLAGQYSNDLLSSLEKMSLGGPYSVRAYPIGEFVSDRATFSSLAWVIDGAVISNDTAYGEYSWSDILDISVFVDYAWGKNRVGDVSDSVVRSEISGWGVQTDWRFPDRAAYVELSAARPFGDEEASNGDDFQFWFSIGIEL